MSGDEDHRGRVIRSLIAGGIGVIPTLTGIGAAGLLTDLSTGALACIISFFAGCFLRLAVEYGVTVPNPNT